MKSIILSALLIVCFTNCLVFGKGSGEKGGWPISCPTVTPAVVNADPFANGLWYEVQRSPRPIGFFAPSCVTYTFGAAYGTPVRHDLTISRKVRFGTDLSVSIIAQTPAASAAGTFATWTNIRSTVDYKAPASFTVVGVDSANPPTWVALYFCQPGANVRILTSTPTPTAQTLQDAQNLVSSLAIPGVNLVSVSQTGC